MFILFVEEESSLCTISSLRANLQEGLQHLKVPLFTAPFNEYQKDASIRLFVGFKLKTVKANFQVLEI